MEAGTVTKPLPFTKAGLQRAIRAARAEGLSVTGIHPDGTLLVDERRPVVRRAPALQTEDAQTEETWVAEA